MRIKWLAFVIKSEFETSIIFLKKAKTISFATFLFLPARSRSDGIKVDPEWDNFTKPSYGKSIRMRLTLFIYWLISSFLSVIDGKKWLIQKGSFPLSLSMSVKCFLKKAPLNVFHILFFYTSINVSQCFCNNLEFSSWKIIKW